MSIITPIAPENAQGQAKELLDAVAATFGAVPNLFRVAAQSPAALDGLLKLFGAVGAGVLSAKVRESIALAVAEANGCDYCLSAHSAISRNAGLSGGEIEAARQARSDDAKTARLLAFAVGLVKRRGLVSRTEVENLLNSGVSAGEVVEVVANVALNTFTNTLNHVAGTEIDFPVVRSALSSH